MVVPLHPRTRKALLANGLLGSVEADLRVIEPVGYLDMIQLERIACVIATDSGGVQEEAFFYRVPCVTLRDETEWIELVESGWNQLASPTCAEVVCRAILDAAGVRGRDVSLYGARGVLALLPMETKGTVRDVGGHGFCGHMISDLPLPFLMTQTTTLSEIPWAFTIYWQSVTCVRRNPSGSIRRATGFTVLDFWILATSSTS